MEIGKIDTSQISGTFPKKWDYCPCIVQMSCTPKRKCLQRIGVYFNNPRLGLATFEILYIRNLETGLIRANQQSVIRLLNKGIINKSRLSIMII